MSWPQRTQKITKRTPLDANSLRSFVFFAANKQPRYIPARGRWVAQALLVSCFDGGSTTPRGYPAVVRLR